MHSNPFIVGIAGLAIVNGIFSPLFLPQCVAMVLVLAPALLIASPSLVFFLAALLAATGTIMLAGVPAAIFERVSGRNQSDTAAYTVWLVATFVLSLPGLLQVASLLA